MGGTAGLLHVKTDHDRDHKPTDDSKQKGEKGILKGFDDTTLSRRLGVHLLEKRPPTFFEICV